LTRDIARPARPGNFPSARPCVLALLLGLVLGWMRPVQALERVPLPASEIPWSALGRVNAGGTSYCTGVLVGPSTMLTASHCLYNFSTKTWRPPSDIHFVAGYLKNGWVAAARARRIVRDPNAVPDGKHPPVGLVTLDWAVVELDSPIGETAGWFPVERRRIDVLETLILQAGYRRDRPFAPEMSPPCRVVETPAKPPLILHDCIVPEGGSGSPLFVVENHRLLVAGIHSAQVRRTTRDEKQPPRILAAVVPLWRFADHVPRSAEPQSGSAEAARRALAAQAGDLNLSPDLSIGDLMKILYRNRVH